MVCSRILSKFGIRNVVWIAAWSASVPLCMASDAQARVVPPSAVVCDACHGIKGEGLKELNAPRLAALQSWYLERQLRNFRAGIRGGNPADVTGAQMRVIASNLTSDSAVIEAAAYFASLLPLPVAAPSIQGSAVRGKALYGACVACHGEKGQGQLSTQAPSLQGANDWYLVTQLQSFRSGTRGRNTRDTNGQTMRAIALTLPDDEAVRDLAAYIGTL